MSYLSYQKAYYFVYKLKYPGQVGHVGQRLDIIEDLDTKKGQKRGAQVGQVGQRLDIIEDLGGHNIARYLQGIDMINTIRNLNKSMVCKYAKTHNNKIIKNTLENYYASTTLIINGALLPRKKQEVIMPRDDQKSWRPIDFVTMQHIEDMKKIGKSYGIQSLTEFMRLVLMRAWKEGMDSLADDNSNNEIPTWIMDAQAILMDVRRHE